VELVKREVKLLQRVRLKLGEIWIMKEVRRAVRELMEGLIRILMIAIRRLVMILGL